MQPTVSCGHPLFFTTSTLFSLFVSVQSWAVCDLVEEIIGQQCWASLAQVEEASAKWVEFGKFPVNQVDNGYCQQSWDAPLIKRIFNKLLHGVKSAAVGICIQRVRSLASCYTLCTCWYEAGQRLRQVCCGSADWCEALRTLHLCLRCRGGSAVKTPLLQEELSLVGTN